MDDFGLGGVSIIVVGGTGQGKTTFVCNLLKRFEGKRLYILDPNEEGAYRPFKNLYGGEMEGEAFTRFAANDERAQGCVNVFEEATPIFMHGNRNKNLVKLLTRKRHKRQVNIFVFHAVNSIPTEMFFYLDYAVLFKTNDRADLLAKKYENFPKITEAVKDLRGAANYSKRIINLRK